MTRPASRTVNRAPAPSRQPCLLSLRALLTGESRAQNLAQHRYHSGPCSIVTFANDGGPTAGEPRGGVVNWQKRPNHRGHVPIVEGSHERGEGLVRGNVPAFTRLPQRLYGRRTWSDYAQFSILSPLTFEKCRWLFVTSVAATERAWLAISVSI